MRRACRSTWTLFGASAYLGAAARAAGVLDIGLAFPRANETYEPTDDFPVVFALQNSELAEHLKPSIWYQVLNVTGNVETLVDSTHEFNWTTASENDPYFMWSHLRVEGEGKLRVLWQPRWSSCDESGDEVDIARNRTDNFLVDFEIKADGQTADLVAATGGDSENCPNEGVGIDVTDETLEAPARSSGRRESETCAVLGSSSPTPTSNPCKVKIDKAAVESMEAADLRERCRGLNPPAECPDESLASPKLAPGAASSLMALLGAAFYLV